MSQSSSYCQVANYLQGAGDRAGRIASWLLSVSLVSAEARCVVEYSPAAWGFNNTQEAHAIQGKGLPW